MTIQYRQGQLVSFRWAGIWVFGKIEAIQKSPEFGLLISLKSAIGYSTRISSVVIFPQATPVTVLD